MGEAKRREFFLKGVANVVKSIREYSKLRTTVVFGFEKCKWLASQVPLQLLRMMSVRNFKYQPLQGLS